MKLLGVLLGAVLVVGVLAPETSAQVTGQVCLNVFHKTNSETICVGVDAYRDSGNTDRLHAFMSGSGGAKRVDVDFIKLWEKTAPQSWAPRASNTNSGYFLSAFVWTTPWYRANYACHGGGFEQFHGEGRLRVRWKDGAITSYFIVNSNDAECVAS